MYAQTRPRFILSSEGVFLGGMEFEPTLTPREKSPLPKMSPEEDRTRDTVDSEPKHYQLSYSGPRTGHWISEGVSNPSPASLEDLDRLLVTWSVSRVLSLLLMVSGCRIRRILLRKVLMNVWIFFSVAVVVLLFFSSVQQTRFYCGAEVGTSDFARDCDCVPSHSVK